MDSKSEINAVTFAYASKLRFKIWVTNIKAENIDGSTFQIFGMVYISF